MLNEKFHFFLMANQTPLSICQSDRFGSKSQPNRCWQWLHRQAQYLSDLLTVGHVISGGKVRMAPR